MVKVSVNNPVCCGAEFVEQIMCRSDAPGDRHGRRIVLAEHGQIGAWDRALLKEGPAESVDETHGPVSVP